MMLRLGNLIAGFCLSNAATVGILWRKGLRAPAAALAFASLIGLSACTGSPATLASQPDFEVTTRMGVATVSIRESLPGMTDSEFAQSVRRGMEHSAPGSVLAGPVEAPFPRLRIVWHVNPIAPRGVSRLFVNIFDGSVPFAYEQQVVSNSAPMTATTLAITSTSRRLFAAIDHSSENLGPTAVVAFTQPPAAVAFRTPRYLANSLQDANSAQRAARQRG
jgi:hypothetical protein